MNSPFPGMDLYLERYWSSVQTHLVVGATRVLNRSLPGDLVARPEERLEIASDDDREEPSTIIADSAVFGPGSERSSGSTAIVAPFKLVVDFVPHTEREGAESLSPKARGTDRPRCMLWKRIWCEKETGVSCCARIRAPWRRWLSIGQSFAVAEFAGRRMCTRGPFKNRWS